MPRSLTIPQLAERCQAEAAHYKQTGQSDERYCFELFRRALIERDEAAWQVIYTQYQSLVATWVHNYSRFPQTNEEADFFINAAFARLWQFGVRADTAAKLDNLGKCLGYLKLCVGSALEDYLRKVKRDALKQAIQLKNYDRSSSEVEEPETFPLTLEELGQALWNTVQDNSERLVAEESWVYGFAPREIQAHHPDLFTATAEVSQIKRNIIKRLRRRFKERLEVRD